MEQCGCNDGLPEIIALAEYEIGFGEQSAPYLAQATIATGTLETVLVPHLVQGLEQVPLQYGLVTAEALGRGRVGHLFPIARASGRQWFARVGCG